YGLGNREKKTIQPLERPRKAFLRKRAARFLCQRASARCLRRGFRSWEVSLHCLIRRARRPGPIQNCRGHRERGKKVHSKRRQTVCRYLGGRPDLGAGDGGLERSVPESLRPPCRGTCDRGKGNGGPPR